MKKQKNEYVTMGLKKALVDEVQDIVVKTWPVMHKSSRTSAVNLLLMYGIETIQKNGDRDELPLPSRSKLKLQLDQ